MTAYTAIAISRLVGAGGAILGQRLAEKLGYAYLDRNILREAASTLGVKEDQAACWEEHVSHAWERLGDILASGPPEANYVCGPMHTVLDQDLFEMESRLIRQAAFSRNVVVIGRAGWWVLRDHPGLVSVFLHAPREARVPEVMKVFHLASVKEAREMIDRVDADRARFVRQMTGLTPGDARLYHLCLDTSRTGMELAERMVMELVVETRKAIGDEALERSGERAQ